MIHWAVVLMKHADCIPRQRAETPSPRPLSLSRRGGFPLPVSRKTYDRILYGHPPFCLGYCIPGSAIEELHSQASSLVGHWMGQSGWTCQWIVSYCVYEVCSADKKPISPVACALSLWFILTITDFANISSTVHYAKDHLWWSAVCVDVSFCNLCLNHY